MSEQTDAPEFRKGERLLVRLAGDERLYDVEDVRRDADGFVVTLTAADSGVSPWLAGLATRLARAEGITVVEAVERLRREPLRGERGPELLEIPPGHRIERPKARPANDAVGLDPR